MPARCYAPVLDSGRSIDEILCICREYIWVKLWANSPIRQNIAAQGGFHYSVQQYEPNKTYLIAFVQSWVNDDFFEVRTRKELKSDDAVGDEVKGKCSEVEEYMDRLNKVMDPCFRNSGFY